jgi:methylated-DNA-[protein]-cysteine S-methyltransferase
LPFYSQSAARLKQIVVMARPAEQTGWKDSVISAILTAEQARKCWSKIMVQAVQHYLIFETAGGYCGIAWSKAGITRFQLPTESGEATERLLLKRLPDAKPADPTPEIAKAVDAVKRYFQGEAVDFSALALDLGPQQAFFASVYDAARKIGWGQTTTYGALAKELGAGPEKARDVGQAMAKNPVALIIPCHRVLAAGNQIGGFSAPGGASAKQRMLKLEGVNLAPPKPVRQQLDLF